MIASVPWPHLVAVRVAGILNEIAGLSNTPKIILPSGLTPDGAALPLMQHLISQLPETPTKRGIDRRPSKQLTDS
jgi:hypothetical protein